MFKITASFIIIGLFFLSFSVVAMPPSSGEDNSSFESNRDFDVDTYINANKILMFVTNQGSFGRDLWGCVFGYDYGTYYPFTTIEAIENGSNISSVIFASGLWMGGMVNGEIRIAIAEYSHEYIQGPMANGTYMPNDISFHVYKLYSDSLEVNPNSDYLNWPVDQGAPVDANGNPEMIGHQMLWTVFNDADPNQHYVDAGNTDPLGIEIQQTVWAYDGTDTTHESVIYIKYKLYNKGSNSIDDFYLSIWSDPDLGGFTDDLVGCDTLSDLFFCYNSNNNDQQFGFTPPAVGFKILDGLITSSPGDTANFDGQLIPDYRNLGMTSFQKYINGTDPQHYSETYNYMQGLNMDGNPLPNGTNYAVPGDPVDGTGDLDISPSDKRMMGTCGPLSFNPGDSQYVLVKLAVGQGTDRLTSITKLKEILNAPTPLLPPTLKAVIDPNPQYLAMLHTIEPVPASVTFGYHENGLRGKDIDYNSLQVSAVTGFDSVIVSPSHYGFNGEVVTVYFPVREFLESYGLLFDTTTQTYTVSGTYSDGESFSHDAELSIIGHSSGDFNMDGQVDITDLVMMVAYFFNGGPPPEIIEAIDLDHDGVVDISDLVLLVNYMFFL